MLLDRINAVNDIKKIDPEDYPALAEEIRQFLIGHISKTGGHLGSNLGTVELNGTASFFSASGGQDHMGCGASVLYS